MAVGGYLVQFSNISDPCHFECDLKDGQSRRCRQNHIRRRYVEIPQESLRDPDPFSVLIPRLNNLPVTAPPINAVPEASPESNDATGGEQSNNRTAARLGNVQDNSVPQETGKTYPKCVRNLVVRFKPTWSDYTLQNCIAVCINYIVCSLLWVPLGLKGEEMS